MISRDKFYIGGQWVAPSSNETIDVHSTVDGGVMGKVPAGTARDIEPPSPRRAARSKAGAQRRSKSAPNTCRRSPTA
jgi:acyl-CoA reductase-like NAD-dependent aldehyde dehydrogenase